MEYRTLGSTDLRVSRIGLGTMTFGEQNTEAEGHAQIDRALDRGVNLVDTSEMYAVPARAETYGATERIIGTFTAATSGTASCPDALGRGGAGHRAGPPHILESLPLSRVGRTPAL